METIFHDAGYRVFPLLPIVNDKCACGGSKCAGKHPAINDWQNTPEWSDEQFGEMDFSNGYGVLCSGLLVIDIDARNGGIKSYEKLIKTHPAITNCGFIVNTGSGGGSRHLYFRLNAKLSLKQSLQEYPGIDFKSSGFVVGPGSPHISGNKYTVGFGNIEDIGLVPESLIAALTKENYHRSTIDNHVIDVTDGDIEKMLSYIDPGCDYDTWIKVGMAIHHTAGETAFPLWNTWSAKSAKYDNSVHLHWESFGKCDNPVTLGTLYYLAHEGGYRLPVTCSLNDFPEYMRARHGKRAITLDTNGIDLLRPPGFVGKIAAWINSQCYYPREHLAVAAALQAVSNLGGMRYYDELDEISPNLVAFCVAGSGTGKESVLKAFNRLMEVGKVTPAVYGGFKSEQEIYRNLLRHQAAFYVVDELGEHLAKISNAVRSGASYLEGVIGTVMSVFTKADSFVLVTGDLKEQVSQKIAKDIAAEEKKEENDLEKIARLKKQQKALEYGIKNPYLSVLGFTTPGKFNELMTAEMATNGFIGRSLIFQEYDDNPVRKPRGTKKPGLPMMMQVTIKNLYNPFTAGMTRLDDRIEQTSKIKKTIPTTEDATAMLDMIQAHFWQLAEDTKEDTGLTAIPRRGYEMVAKLSMVLAIPEGARTIEHVRWAFACVSRDIARKTNLANSNSAENPLEALMSKILGVVDDDYGTSKREIGRKCRGAKFDLKEVLDDMVENNILRVEQIKTRGRLKEVYFKV